MSLLKQVLKEKQQIVRETTLAWRQKREEFNKYNPKIEL